MRTIASYEGKPVMLEAMLFPDQIRGGVKGMSCRHRDGYLIVIDSALTEDERAHTLGHELAHVYLGHMEGDEASSLADCEEEAEEAADAYYQLYLEGSLPVAGGLGERVLPEGGTHIAAP